VVSSPELARLCEAYARDAVVDAVRGVIEDLRERIKSGDGCDEDSISVAAIVADVDGVLARQSRRRILAVVNASGVVLHTNLGRAVLARSAVDALTSVATRACALEYEVASGQRGDRDRIVEEHLCALTGAEAATVVNNNAAAVLLMLSALADQREVIVSRGELIEIGGSFRIPDVMRKSGALLREVGTTNRTHPKDYQAAINPGTAMLLKVHTSNYRIVGFTASVDVPELRSIADSHEGVLVAEDLGAGALVDLSRWGLPPEPVVAQRIAAGADIVTFSGDKLLGGPQCGIAVGRSDCIDAMRRDPLKRALRLDKMTLAALEETLRIYRFDPAPEASIPTLHALSRPLFELEEIGRHAVEMLREVLGPTYSVDLEAAPVQVGSGSQPEHEIESRAVVIHSGDRSATRIAADFRAADPPIVGRIEKQRFLLDLRLIDSAEQLVPRPR